MAANRCSVWILGNVPPTVKIDAATTNRSLLKSTSSRPQLKADPPLKFWRLLINTAVHDAKKTWAGIPTDKAIAARWWLEEHKPKESDKAAWRSSFECACIWLGLVADEERKRLIDEIDAHLLCAYKEHVVQVLYVRRAAVLTCAGVPTAIAGQYQLGLVSEADYEDVAGIEHPEPERVIRQLHAREERKRTLPGLTAAA